MSDLRAGCGFFTSIRPGKEGALLNLNQTTSTFLLPVEISSITRTVVKERKPASPKDLNYISQLLRGASVRTMYTRSNYKGSEVDYNLEAAHLKVFIQFGKATHVKTKNYELVLEGHSHEDKHE
jgi:hypothetical protein